MDRGGELVRLFAGDLFEDSWAPCYRYPLAYAICTELKPKTFDSLCTMVYGSIPLREVPLRAIESLLAAFEEWDRVNRAGRRKK